MIRATTVLITFFLWGCSPTTQPEVSFEKEVNTVLQENCAECHLNNGPGLVKSGFSVASYSDIMKGTKFGPVIVAGNPSSSTLLILIEGKADPSINMPHNRQPLNTQQIDTIKQWIIQGARNN